jgi:hypothetical protein
VEGKNRPLPWLKSLREWQKSLVTEINSLRQNFKKLKSLQKYPQQPKYQILNKDST